MFKCSTRVDFVCTHFFCISQWSQSETTFTCIGSVNVTGIIQPGKKQMQMQMQILSQETWSVSPGSTAHPLTSRVIIFKHCNCQCSVHLKDDLKRNRNSTQKIKILENFNFLKTESRSKWKNSAFLREGSQSKPAVQFCKNVKTGRGPILQFFVANF